MVARCAHADAGGLFRIWPIFSAAALRRKVLEVLTCGGGFDGGGGSGSCRGRTAYRSPQRMPMPRPRPRSDRLAELLRAEEQPSECSDEAEATEAADAAARKEEALEELKAVVAALQDGGGGGDGCCMSRVEAAKAVRRKAKDDAGAREMLAMLGAIPPLVAMLDEDGEDITTAALYALLNLGIGNDTNKAAIVQAGAVHKMLRIADGGGASGALTTEAVVANFLCLSALDANKPVIGASGAAPFLVRAFQAAACSTTEQARHDALRALLNLSIAPANAPHLLAAGLAPAMVAAVGDDAAPMTDRALAALCNLVAACPEGRRAVSRAPDAVPSLVDVLNWADEPGCQEKAAYVLMVLAHRSYGDRAAMVEAGASSALLELTLVGTALAQKRASRILEILRADKGKQVADDASGVVATVSAPQERRCRADGEESVDGEFVDAGMSAEKRAVRQLVQQSLQSNMRRIVRRARLPQDFAPASAESLKTLTASSTSKSLPF